MIDYKIPRPMSRLGGFMSGTVVEACEIPRPSFEEMHGREETLGLESTKAGGAVQHLLEVINWRGERGVRRNP